jgi:hypothetical protein
VLNGFLWESYSKVLHLSDTAFQETSLQVSEAREKITKAQCLIQWRTALSSRQAQSRRAGTLAAAFLLRRSWALWQNRVRKVSMKKRREFLRDRMKLVQKTRGLKLRKDAWAVILTLRPFHVLTCS